MADRNDLRHDGGACGCYHTHVGRPCPETAVAAAVEETLLHGLFPDPIERRRLLRAVGRATVLGALASILPIDTLTAIAQERKPLEKSKIAVGFLPITCATPLIYGESLGLYAKQGLEVSLQKIAGIGLIRDKMINGELDVSQQVMPVALTMSAGVGGTTQSIKVLTILNQNGNSLVLANKHKDNRDPAKWKGFTFAVPFEQSHQALQLRNYLASHGLDPDQDVKYRVVPPTEYVSSLRVGSIDGFFGGEPGGQRAVYEGAGFIHLISKEIWAGHPCCSVTASESWIKAHPNTFMAFYRADLTLFLVEEPEAHLHPQLQAAVLSFLKDQATQSRAIKTEDGPAGQIQVVVASHSPNLSAWVSSKQLVVFKSVVPAPLAPSNTPQKQASRTEADAAAIRGGIAEGTGATDAVIRRSTRCIPLSQIDLNDLQRRKIDRYLDVTKAALLFGGRVLLVEGIAEALLLPVIAEHFTLKGEPDKLRLFRSAVFVPIDGVDFVPYVNLLTRQINEARIAERVVIMTDGDHGVGESSEDEEDDEPAAGEGDGSKSHDVDEEVLPGERRKRALDALAKMNGAEGVLSAITSRYSLESELLEASNAAILRAAYVSLHKRSGKKWDKAAALEGDARANAIQGIFKNARKGDFAQVLANLIERIDQNKHTFVVPKYIDDTIREVVA